MPTQRWIVEDLKEGEWEPAGWVDAPGPSQAVDIASAQWRDVTGLKLRAILWSQATAEQQDAAEYERELRVRLHETSGAPGTFADQWAHGELPLHVNSPQKAVLYRQAIAARRGVALGVATLIAAAVLLAVARPSPSVLIVAGVVGAIGATSGYSRARRGLLEPGNEQAGAQAPFGRSALAMPLSLVIAFLQRSWLAAAIYVVTFFFSVLLGIALSEVVSSRSR